MPRIFACARFPGILPTKSCAKSTSLFAIPPLFIIFPAKINNGTANNEKLSTPVFIFCIVINVIWSHESDDIAVTIDDTTMLTEIGTPKKSKTPKTTNNIIVVIAILIKTSC